jgi:hypothetical protein
VRNPRQSRSAAGDQASQLNIQPPSWCWVWVRWSRLALIVASSNSSRASESGSGREVEREVHLAGCLRVEGHQLPVQDQPAG